MAKPRTLSEHAAYELVLAGMTDNEDPQARKAASDVMALIKRFEKQDHTEKTAMFTLNAFETLASFLPLTPITDDPQEWDKFEIDKTNVDTKEVEKKIVWNSKRATSIFSEDEGKTFYDQRTGKTGTSLDHIVQAEEKAAEKADREKRKAAAAERAKAPKPSNVMAQPDTDVPAAEAPATAQKYVPTPELLARQKAYKEHVTDGVKYTFDITEPDSPIFAVYEESFINLAESPAGFGNTDEEALAQLTEQANADKKKAEK